MFTKFKQSKPIGAALFIGVGSLFLCFALTSCSASSDYRQGDSASQVIGDSHAFATIEPASTIADSDAAPTTQVKDTDNGDAKVYYGEWIIKSVIAYGNVGTYSSDDAEKMIGLTLHFSDDEAHIIGDQPSDETIVIKNPVYSESWVTEDTFIENFRMTFIKLEIEGGSKSLVNIADSDGNAASALLLKDDGTMIIIAGGTFFELSN